MLYNIYFSPTGGTEKVSRALASYLSPDNFTPIDLVLRDASSRQTSLDHEDIAVIAAPVYGGRIPSIAATRIRMIKGNGARAVVLVSYGNRAYDDALLELRDIAASCGFRVIAAVAAIAEHSIVRDIATGRPDDQDREDLAGIASSIRDKISREDDRGVEVPGAHPYRLFHGIPLRTYAGEDCIMCGNCAFECPVNAIPPETPNAPSGGSCISCMRCVSVCPVQTRTAGEETVEAIRQKISPACSDRKAYEYWL